MSILYSDVVSCSIDVVGDVDIFRFPGIAGEVITVLASLTTGGFGAVPCIELFDPTGSTVDADCSGSGAQVDVTLTQTGLHSVLVSEAANDNVLDYTLVVERLAPPSNSARYICPACNLQGSINPVGDLDLFFLSGTAGDVITLLASLTSGGFGAVPCIELFDPTGGTVDADCSGSGAQIDVTLTQTGVYTILVGEAANDNVLDYTLSYQCIVGVCLDLVILIFADGFESGDTSAWSGSVP